MANSPFIYGGSNNLGKTLLPPPIAGVVTEDTVGNLGILNVGTANGLATLDASGKVPASELPSTVLEYQGLWNPTTNSPLLSDATGTNGYVYQVSTAYAGPVVGLSNPTMVNFQVGNLVIYSSALGQWEQAGSLTGVTSVNGAVGAVTVNAINQLTGDGTAGPASGSQSAVFTLTATSNSTLVTLSALSLPGSQVTGNISGNAANITATSNSTLTTLSSLSLPYSQVTGAPAAGITQLTGDGTAGPGSGSQALTLATVNSNVGSFTNANITVNAKGLITAASNGSGSGALNSQTFTSSGSFTVPAGITSIIVVGSGGGGGGGGGGGNYSLENFAGAGGGGGGGAPILTLVSPVTASQVLTVTIGGGGTAGTAGPGGNTASAGGAGGAGAASTITGTGVSLYFPSAGGGGGGANNNAGAGAAVTNGGAVFNTATGGGSGGVGGIATSGAGGSSSIVGPNGTSGVGITGLFGSGGSGGGSSANASANAGGTGGTSPYATSASGGTGVTGGGGGGGGGASFGTGGAGGIAAAPGTTGSSASANTGGGGGGGGGSTHGTNTSGGAGGAGGSGMITIYWI